MRSLAAAALLMWGPLEPAAAQTFADEFTAVSANVGQPGRPVEIRILAWSSMEERDRLLAAVNPPPPEPSEDVVAEGRGGRGGRGRGGRGGRGGESVDPVLAALAEAPTMGYIWTERVAGYAIRHAYRSSLADGRERIVLATDRRLGRYTTAWDPVETDLEFTVIEIRLDANGEGEGKSSLTTGVVVDEEAGTFALDDYAGTMPVLENVRRRR